VECMQGLNPLLRYNFPLFLICYMQSLTKIMYVAGTTLSNEIVFCEMDESTCRSLSFMKKRVPTYALLLLWCLNEFTWKEGKILDLHKQLFLNYSQNTATKQFQASQIDVFEKLHYLLRHTKWPALIQNDK
jgi:hypothetical protein